MTGAYSAALLEAARSADNTDAVERVKQVVINELRATDERVRIVKTDYFNHSFVPDLVLDWQAEKEGRYVFVRPNLEPGYLLEDVELTGDTKPIFYCLSDPERRSHDATQVRLEDASERADTLITGPAGLEELIEQRRSNSVVRLASSAVLQGARGVFDSDKAGRVVEALTTGMDAAARMEARGTELAARTLSQVFDSPRSVRLSRLLQAIWLGSGGTSGNFPGRFDLANGLDEGAISYLLEIGQIEDQSFWKRIGRQLSLDLLTKLNVVNPSSNFQMLVTANLDILSAKACRLVRDGPWLGESTNTAGLGESNGIWEMRAGNLVFRTRGLAAYVAGRKDELAASVAEAPGNEFKELTRRLSAHEIKLTELTFKADGKSVSYSSDSAINIEHDEQLRAIVSALAPHVTVQSAVALLQGHSPITCDFQTSTLSGKTTAVYPVSSMINIAMALLAGKPGEEIAQLEEFAVNSQGDSGTDPTLFDV